MSKIVITRKEHLAGETCPSEKGFGYTEYCALPEGVGEHSLVSFYELPPRHSNYPYHYHFDQDETFYIISGEGVLKTPDGEKPVRAGDLIFCPAGEDGAHRLTNTSDSEMLVYLDFDAIPQRDVCIYPDSHKMAVWSPEFSGVYRIEDKVDYYDRENAELSAPDSNDHDPA